MEMHRAARASPENFQNMRQAGTLSDEASAQRFCDFLLTEGIASRFDPSAGEWNIWIYDDDDLERGRQLLDEFKADPQQEKYHAAKRAADQIRQQAAKQERQRSKQTVDMRERWRSPQSSIPVTALLIVISIFVGISTKLVFAGMGVSVADNWENPVTQALMFAPIKVAGDRIAWNGLQAIEEGQIWRAVTPMFLHFGLFHLLFNMLWLYQLGGAIELRRGPWRYLLLVLTIAAVSNFLQYYFPFNLWPLGFDTPIPTFGGMSGVVFGLFGYVWMKHRYAPELGFFMDDQTVYLMLAWAVVCSLNIFPISVANTAHFAGLFVGMAWAVIPLLPRILGGR